MGKTLKRQRQRAAREEEPVGKKQKVINPKKFSFLVSTALQQRRWDDALKLLEAMRAVSQAPKLGSVQRWVRDADCAGDEALAAHLLDGILRAAGGLPRGKPAAASPGAADCQPVRRHAPWVPPPEAEATPAQEQKAAYASDTANRQDGASTADSTETSTAAATSTSGPEQPSPEQYLGQFWVVPHADALHRPANRHDVLHAFPPNTIRFKAAHPPAVRLEVPHVPGAFVLRGVLSQHECAQLVAASQALGYSDEVDYTTAWRPDGANGHSSSHAGTGSSAGRTSGRVVPHQQAAAPSAARGYAAGLAGLEAGRPASGCAWLADDGLVAAVFGRCRHLLPQELAGGALAGINARWRFYSEETQGADLSGPIAIISTIVGGFVVGICFLLSVTFSIQDQAMLSSLDNATGGGNYVMQVACDVFNARYGSGIGALGLMVVPLLCSLFCGNACLIANSRAVWAFSRDGALPLSRYWRQVHPTFKAPVNAVWVCVLLCFILGLPMLQSTVALAAITSIGVVGLYISYVVPLIFRLTVGRKTFVHGPFNLGRFGVPITFVACLWAAFAIIMFVLPQVYPVTSTSPNYAPVAVGIVLLGSTGWWVVDAHKWFKGPRRTVELDEEEAQGGDSGSDSVQDFKAALKQPDAAVGAGSIQ